MTKQLKVGSMVEVNEFNQMGRNIGRGRIEEIVTMKSYDGPVAAIRIPGMSGRFLRTLKELAA